MANDWLTLHWGETLADDIELLLTDLCVGWGYCNYSVSGDALLRDGGGVITATALAEATLAANGDTDSIHRPDIERLFAYRYGAISVCEADYAPGVEGPYRVAPDPPEAHREPKDPVLTSARALLREPRASGAETTPSLDPDAVMRSIRKVRRRKGFALGSAEIEACRDELRTLMIVHERLTGRCLNSDPEGRVRLGLGQQPGTFAQG
jgi:hypothetical protein